MKRRRLLQLSGIVASGGGMAIGSGAFTSVSAERSVRIAVADDEDAYLGLNATSRIGRSYDTGNPEEVAFSIPGVQEDTSSAGVGPNSRYTFSDLIEITNQGDDTVVVWSRSGDLPSGIDEILLINNSNNAKTLNNKTNGAVLSPGETLTAGLTIDTSDEIGSFEVTFTILAEEQQ